MLLTKKLNKMIFFKKINKMLFKKKLRNMLLKKQLSKMLFEKIKQNAFLKKIKQNACGPRGLQTNWLSLSLATCIYVYVVPYELTHGPTRIGFHAFSLCLMKKRKKNY